MIKISLSKDGSVCIKGRSVKNKPIEPAVKHVGLSKKRYMKTILHAYRGIGYFDYDIDDLSELSLRQWMNRQYYIPKGYMLKFGANGTNFRKITQEDLIRHRIYSKKSDLKSNPFVK